jgi:hypothetical protein
MWSFDQALSSVSANVDVLYTFPAGTTEARWTPYLGAGPNFALSHQDLDLTDEDDGNRFDFSDTDFNGGFNFIAGARNQRGLFLELKATAWACPTCGSSQASISNFSAQTPRLAVF